jgi:hypothetical protein
MTMTEFCSLDNCAAGDERSAATEENVGQVLWGFCCRPKECILRRWNWKSALLSSLARATIFFAANLTAGQAAALAAMTREFGFRAIASSFKKTSLPGAVPQSSTFSYSRNKQKIQAA